MPKSVPRLLGSLYNTPHLATPDTLENALEYLNSREFQPSLLVKGDKASREAAEDMVKVESGIAVLSIEGSLTYRYSWINALCGITSYQELKANVERAISLGAKSIIFDTNSGGGQAYACFETAESIKKMASEKGVKLIAYVDGSACSGAYALVSVCDEIIANPMAEVGSIGVVMQLRNPLPMAAKEGVEIKFVYSGKEKIPFDEDTLKFKRDFLNDLQKGTDKLYQEFVSFTAKNRSLSEEKIRNTEAKIFRADEAIELGLIDSIMTHDEFYQYVAEKLVASNGGAMPLQNPLKLIREKFSDGKEMTSGDKLGATDQKEGPESPEQKGEQQEMTVETQVPEANVFAEELAKATQEKEALAKQLADLTAQMESMQAAATQKMKADLTASLKEYSFLTEELATNLVDVLMGVDEAQREYITSAFAAADKALEASGIKEEEGVSGQPPADVSAEEKSQSRVMGMIKQSRT